MAPGIFAAQADQQAAVVLEDCGAGCNLRPMWQDGGRGCVEWWHYGCFRLLALFCGVCLEIETTLRSRR